MNQIRRQSLHPSFNGVRLKKKVTNGAFGKSGVKEVEFDYVDIHGPKHKRTGQVIRKTTRINY